jgi:trimethylamine corrinoid protein
VLEKNLYLVDSFLLTTRKESTTVAKEQEMLAAAKKAIIDYDVVKAEEVAKEALASGVDPVVMIEKGFTAGIAEVGDRFDSGEAYLPELILAADAMKAGTAVCEAAFPKGTIKAKKKVVIGTVEGDIHDIGKSIVASFLTANGFEVHDIGRDAPAEKFVETAHEVKADVVGASALLTTTMEQQKKIVEALKEAGLRDKVKIIIGGAPTSQEWADRIGADAYAENAAEAVAKVKQLAGLQ